MVGGHIFFYFCSTSKAHPAPFCHIYVHIPTHACMHTNKEFPYQCHLWRNLVQGLSISPGFSQENPCLSGCVCVYQALCILPSSQRLLHFLFGTEAAGRVLCHSLCLPPVASLHLLGVRGLWWWAGWQLDQLIGSAAGPMNLPFLVSSEMMMMRDQVPPTCRPTWEHHSMVFFASIPSSERNYNWWLG